MQLTMPLSTTSGERERDIACCIPVSSGPLLASRANALVQHLVNENKRYDAKVDAGGFALSEPRASDVILSSWMKIGTTTMQQMVYQSMCAAGRAGDDGRREVQRYQ